MAYFCRAISKLRWITVASSTPVTEEQPGQRFSLLQPNYSLLSTLCVNVSHTFSIRSSSLKAVNLSFCTSVTLGKHCFFYIVDYSFLCPRTNARDRVSVWYPLPVTKRHAGICFARIYEVKWQEYCSRHEQPQIMTAACLSYPLRSWGYRNWDRPAFVQLNFFISDDMRIALWIFLIFQTMTSQYLQDPFKCRQQFPEEWGQCLFIL